MAKKITDLRKPKPAQQIPPQLKAIVGKTERLPMMSGQLILADSEKVELRKLGWKDGDPIPADLSERIAAVQQEIRQESETFIPPVPLNTPALRVNTVDIGSLPQAKQKELRQAMEEAKQQIKRAKSGPKSPLGPGVSEAIDLASSIEIDNDLPTKTTRAAKKTEDTESAGGELPVKRCPHCNFDLDQEDPIVIELQDRINYEVACGGTRFRKRITLSGGKLVVDFRALTSRESDMAYRQMALDAQRDIKDKAVQGDDVYWRNLMSYRLVMGLERIWSEQTGPIEIEEVDKILVDEESCPSPNTKLWAFYPHVIETALPTESLRRIVGAAHHDFQRLLEKLEAESADPNWGRTAAGSI